MKRLLLLVVLCGLVAVGYTKVMARLAPGSPPSAAARSEQADRIRVSKADRQLHLLRDGAIIRSYRIAMGSNWDQGHKQEEGDEPTPEGSYVIARRNPRSMAHFSLHISYPRPTTRRRPRRQITIRAAIS